MPPWKAGEQHTKRRQQGGFGQWGSSQSYQSLGIEGSLLSPSAFPEGEAISEFADQNGQSNSHLLHELNGKSVFSLHWKYGIGVLLARSLSMQSIYQAVKTPQQIRNRDIIRTAAIGTCALQCSICWITRWAHSPWTCLPPGWITSFLYIAVGQIWGVWQ